MEENISLAYAPLLLYFFIEGKILKIYVLSGSYPRQRKKTYPLLFLTSCFLIEGKLVYSGV